MRRSIIRLALYCCAAVPFLAMHPAGAQGLTVTRATLSNGLRVIVVHDPLAPVATAVMNYRAGSDEQTLPGLAHATEHMMFRGSRTLSSSSFMDIVGLTGGAFNADTQDAITQYFFTVPAQYLDVALRLERSRATGLEMAQSQWNQERGAITQEVTQDNSVALYRLFTKIERRMLAGTPYAKNGLGTVYGFAHEIGSSQLLHFYHTWYHPNNAVYVIVGDVDGPSTIARVRKLFGDVPSAPVPPPPAVHLQPIRATTYRESSSLPVTVVMLGFRMPGYASSDYAAGQILGDVLSSQRGALYGLVASGKMLDTGFQEIPFLQTAIGLDYGVVSASADPAQTAAAMRAVLAQYRATGVPADLVDAAKRREIAQLEFARNSIQDLALSWSEAVASQGLHSPNDMVAAFRAVTPAQVDRVLRADFVDARSVTAYAVPKNNGQVSVGASSLAAENNTIPPSAHQPLPAWASGLLAHVHVPAQTLAPSISVLPNGLRLIVQPESASASVTVTGEIRNDPQVQEPPSQEGVNDVTQALMPYGTTSYDRLAYQAQLDRIAANVTTGTTFSLQVLSQDFDRGVQLLADDELHPAFDPAAFSVVRMQDLQGVTGEMRSPDRLAAMAMADALYPKGDPAQRFATPATVSALTLADVRAWYAAAYRPDLTTIVVVGDVTPARARAIVERYFGGWHADGPKPSTNPPPVPENAPSGAVVAATGRVQSQVTLDETVGVSRTAPAWAALQVANTALTGGFYSSLLYHDLREVHGYAYEVSSNLNVGPTRGDFSIGYACDPQNIVPAQELVVNDLLRLQREPLSSQRLQRAKALLMGAVPIRESSYDGVAAQFLEYAMDGLPWNQNLVDAHRELSAGAGDVQRAMAQWIRPRDFVRVVTGPGPR
jgi:zinc protease